MVHFTFFHISMGFFMYRKVMIKSILIGSAMLCLSSLSFATDSTVAAPKVAKDTVLQLTVQELAKYDGKDGRLGYVAIDSVIYDVSHSKSWKNGIHNGTKGRQ